MNYMIIFYVLIVLIFLGIGGWLLWETRDVLVKERLLAIFLIIPLETFMLSMFAIVFIKTQVNENWEAEYWGQIAINTLYISCIALLAAALLTGTYFLVKWLATNTKKRKASGMGIFKDTDHEEFFIRLQKTTGKTDPAHRALFFMIGINKETRDNYSRIYDVKRAKIRRSCLEEEWQTDATREICLVAMSLFNGDAGIDLSLSSSPEDEPFAKTALILRRLEDLRDTVK